MQKKFLSALALTAINLIYSMTPQDNLNRAIAKNDSDTVRELLANHTINLNPQDSYTIAPIIQAITQSASYNPNIYIIIDLLLDNGTNANYVSILGQTPIYEAAQRCDTLIIQKLKNKGAKINPYMLLCEAIRKGHEALFDLALNYGAKPSKEHVTLAIVCMRPLFVRKLIRQLSVNQSDFDNAVVLYNAVDNSEDLEYQSQAASLKVIMTSLYNRLKTTHPIGLISTKGIAVSLPIELAEYIGYFLED